MYIYICVFVCAFISVVITRTSDTSIIQIRRMYPKFLLICAVIRDTMLNLGTYTTIYNMNTYFSSLLGTVYIFRYIHDTDTSNLSATISLIIEWCVLGLNIIYMCMYICIHVCVFISGAITRTSDIRYVHDTDTSNLFIRRVCADLCCNTWYKQCST